MSSLSKSFKQMKKNLKAEMDAIANREWLVEYKGHQIRIVNSSLIETVYIDGVLAVEKQHKSVFRQIKPYVKLHTTIPSTKEKLTVKIGGINAVICTVKVGNKVIFNEKTKIEMLPWQNKQPIYSFLMDALEENKDIRQITLPDDAFYHLDEDEPRYAMGLRVQLTEQSEIANMESKSLIKKLQAQLTEPTTKRRQALYEKVMDEDYLEFDRYFLEVFKEEKFNKDNLKREAMWFIENATHRYAFIFGLELLRFTDYAADMPQLKKIALHEDFTLFIVELMEKLPNANTEIFELARQVDVWGRIFAVNYLTAETAEQKNWLMTDGYNGMFPELFADKANVHHVLEVGETTPEQYKAIGQMIVDLIRKGDVENYDRASDTFLFYAKLAKEQIIDLQGLYPIAVMHDFLTDEDDSEWEERYENDWKPIDRILITKETTKLLEQEQWHAMVLEALKNDSKLEVPIEVARAIDMDITEILLEKMSVGIYEEALYEALLEVDDIHVVKKVVAFLEKEVQIKAATEDQIRCIYMAVDYLEDFSGVGVSFLEKFIEMDEPSIQHIILMSIDEWDEDRQWLTPKLVTAIEGFAKDKSDKELRYMAKQFLKG